MRSRRSRGGSETSNHLSTICSPHDCTNHVRLVRRRGHIYDVAEDGSECRWARILVFEPPNRVVFSWDISPTWQVEVDPSRTSEVEVRFVAETPEQTRVELEHRHLDRHGDGWEGVREGVADDAGWPLYLARFAYLLFPVHRD